MVVSGLRYPLPPPLHLVLPLEIGKLSERKLIFFVSNVSNNGSNVLLIFSVFFWSKRGEVVYKYFTIFSVVNIVYYKLFVFIHNEEF